MLFFSHHGYFASGICKLHRRYKENIILLWYNWRSSYDLQHIEIALYFRKKYVKQTVLICMSIKTDSEKIGQTLRGCSKHDNK